MKMGDRGNIKVYNEWKKDKAVWLYSHWDGRDMWKILQEALGKHERWDDGPYLTRIIFCELVKDDVGGKTGYGISVDMTDNEYLILGVNPEKQEVAIETESGEVLTEYSFEEYLELKEDPRRDKSIT